MKNKLRTIGIAIALACMPIVAWAVQITVPSAPTNGYGLVSTSTGNYIFTQLPSCSTASNALTFNTLTNGFGCNTISGSGGSAGTWSTTTSQVPGTLINYSNNATDVVVIGSTSTTTAKFFFDPNSALAKIVGSLFVTGSTTLNSLFVNTATTSNLAILGVPTSSILKTNGLGQVTNAIPGTDYQSAGTYVVNIGPVGQLQSNATITFASSTTGTDFSITGAANTIAFNLPTASSVNRGLLSPTDWSTFNGKQVAGNYITALTGDGTASGPGSVPLTLATVNANVGSFTNANVTVNGKGLITAISNGSAFSTTSADFWKTQRDFFSTTSANAFIAASTTIPTGTPTLGNVLLGNGTNWTSVATSSLGITGGSSGTPGGSSGQIQYNASGSFGGVSSSTASCSGTVSCTPFSVIATSPVSIVGSGSATGLGTTSPWTVGDLVQVFSNGNVNSIASSSLKLTTSSFLSPNISQWTNNAGYLTSAVTSAQQSFGTAQTGAITFATSSDSFNGLNANETITNSGSTFTFANNITGTLTAAGGGTGLTATGASSTVLTTDGTNPKWNKLATSQLTNDSGFLTSTFAYPFPGNATSTNITFSNGLTGALTGNASTATALAANGTNCSAGNYPLGVDDSGNSEGCTLANTGTVTAVSVVSANGLAGSSSGGATPALTLSTTVTGVVKGNGTSFSAAANGTDLTLLTTTNCATIAGNVVNAVTASGGVTCGAAFSTTSADAYISASSTIAHPAGGVLGNLIQWNGSKWISVATSTLGITSGVTPGGSAGQLQYNASGSLGGISTTTVSCSGSSSCTPFTVLGSSPITISSTGGSGSAAGTWSTTTSQTPGTLINYSNNATDILSVGGNATTSDAFYVDPNASSAVLGIGTSSPYAALGVDGRGIFNQDVRANFFTSTSTTLASVFPYASTTALTASQAIYDTALGTPAGSFLAVDASGKLISTTSPTGGTGTNYFSIAGQGIQTNTGSAVGINLAPALAALEVLGTSTGESGSALTAWNNAATPVPLFSVTDGGAVMLGTTTSPFLGTSQGGVLGILATTTVGPQIFLGNSSVTHGLTNIIANNRYFASFSESNANFDGLTIRSLSIGNRAGMTISATQGPSSFNNAIPSLFISGTGSSGASQAVVPNAGTVMQFANFNTVMGTFMGSGNFGLGTSTPWRTLSVNGSSDLGINALAGFFTATSTINPSVFTGGLTAFASSTIGDGSGTGGLTVNGNATTTGNVQFGLGTTQAIGLNASGNFGIGTTTQDSSLDVAGSVRFEGASAFVSPSISGALIGAGCDSGDTTGLTGLASTTVFVTVPQVFPGNGISMYTMALTSTSARTYVCSAVAVTPNASVYNVRIIK